MGPLLRHCCTSCLHLGPLQARAIKWGPAWLILWELGGSPVTLCGCLSRSKWDNVDLNLLRVHLSKHGRDVIFNVPPCKSTWATLQFILRACTPRVLLWFVCYFHGVFLRKVGGMWCVTCSWRCVLLRTYIVRYGVRKNNISGAAKKTRAKCTYTECFAYAMCCIALLMSIGWFLITLLGTQLNGVLNFVQPLEIANTVVIGQFRATLMAKCFRRSKKPSPVLWALVMMPGPVLCEEA